MKPLILSILAVGTIAGAVYAADPVSPTRAVPPGTTPTPAPAPAPKTDFSKIFKSEGEKNNYAVGMSWASQIKMRLKGQDFALDAEAMTRGFRDALNDTNIITEAQMKEVLTDLNVAMRAKMEEKRKEEMEKRRIQGEKNKAEGEAFLAKNKTEPGVITTASGLQYKILKEGTGPNPKLDDGVTVNYTGTFIDGKEFDSSAKAGKPYPLQSLRGGVVQGWLEALPMMKAGAKWKVFLPSNLGYGEAGRGDILPNTVLIFEMELVSIQPAPALPPVPPLPTGPAGSPNGAPLTSDIIKVPSAEGLKKGEKIETIKAEDLEKERAKEAAKNGGGSTAPK